MGLVFMFSLVIIMFGGMTLVTADMAVGIIGIFHKRITWPLFFKGILFAYIGNFAGSMFFMWLTSKGGSFAAPAWILQAHAMAVRKTGMSSREIFAMAIVCTWTLQTAAFMFIKANDDIAKIAMAAYGPLAFVAGMTEHCIANIGFLALPLFQQDLWLEAYTATADKAPVMLHWGFGQYGWAHNQLYTILGNFIGGIFFVGLAFQLVSHSGRVSELYRDKNGKMLKL
jgi:formate/nitrite transporter FocA (FNT family)